MLTIFLVFQGSLQEVIAWGLIGWKYYANVNGPIQCEALANLGIVQVACAEKHFLILCRNGRVYTQAYNSDTLVSDFSPVCINTFSSVLLHSISLLL